MVSEPNFRAQLAKELEFSEGAHTYTAGLIRLWKSQGFTLSFKSLADNCSLHPGIDN